MSYQHPPSIGSLWNSASAASKAIANVLSPNAVVNEKDVVLAFDSLLWGLRDDISGDKVAFIVSDTKLLSQFASLADSPFTTPSILSMTNKVWIMLVEFVSEHWNPHEEYLSLILNEINLFFSSWLSGKRNRQSKSVIQFLPLVELLLKTFITNRASIKAYSLDSQNSHLAVFEITRSIILTKLQLTANNKPNASPQFSTLDLTLNYICLINTNFEVELEFKSSHFIQTVTDLAINEINGNTGVFYYYMKAFKFICDSIKIYSVHKIFVENAHLAFNTVCALYTELPNPIILEYCLKTHSLFCSSEVLRKVSHDLLLNSELFNRVLWCGAFQLDGSGDNSSFYCWFSNLLENAIINDLVIPYKTKKLSSTTWLSEILFNNVKVMPTEVESIANSIAEAVAEADTSTISNANKLNDEVPFIKLLIARLNFLYVFDPPENEEFLTFLLILLKKCNCLTLLKKESCIVKSINDLSTFDLNLNKFNIGLLINYNYSDQEQLPNHLQFIKWIRLINGDSKIRDKIFYDFGTNYHLLKKFLVDIYVILKAFAIVSPEECY